MCSQGVIALFPGQAVSFLQHKRSTLNDLVPAVYLLMDCSQEGISLYKFSLDRWEGPHPFPLISYFYGHICCSESPVYFSLWSTVFCSFLHLLFMQCCFIPLHLNSFSVSFPYPSLLPQFLFSLSLLSFSLSLPFVSHPGSLSSSLPPLPQSLIFHHSLSTLSSAQP